MRAARIALAALLCVGAVAAGVALGAQLPPLPSPAVYPPTQRLPIHFSHKQHLHFKLKCDFCHERADRSTSPGDVLTPSEEPCRTCHKIERDKPEKEDLPEARCDACHIYPPPAPDQKDRPKDQKPDWAHPLRVEIDPPNLRFNHRIHSERGIDCTRCHQKLDEVEEATRDGLPRMSLCLGCHNRTAQDQRAPAKCTTCHLSQVDGTLRTAFPTGTLVPSGALKGDAHTPDFATHHAEVARDKAYCESCHREDFCMSCHNGVVKPMSFHGNDYLSIHAVDARKASLRCEGCHRKQTFCLGCHERSGLVDTRVIDAPNALAHARPPTRFHPPYEKWVMPPRTPEHHSWQAERNVRTCVSCHREDTCLECHSTTAGPGSAGRGQPFNVSPHPAGFAGSRSCTSLAQRNGRVCLKCHAPSDAHLGCR